MSRSAAVRRRSRTRSPRAAAHGPARSRPRCRPDRGGASASAGSPDAATSAAASTAAASNSAQPSVPCTDAADVDRHRGADAARRLADHLHGGHLGAHRRCRASRRCRAVADRPRRRVGLLRVPVGARPSLRPAAPPRAAGRAGSPRASPSRPLRASRGGSRSACSPGSPRSRARGPPSACRRQAGGTHQLGEPGRLAIDHGPRGLGRHVAGAEPGAPRRHDQPVRSPASDSRRRLRCRGARRARRPAARPRTRLARRIASARSPDASSRVPCVTPSETVTTAAVRASMPPSCQNAGDRPLDVAWSVRAARGTLTLR